MDVYNEAMKSRWWGFMPILMTGVVVVSGNWNAGRLETEINQAVKKSVETNTEVVVTVPSGINVIERKIKVNVGGARIKLVGNNSTLKLTENMSELKRTGNKNVDWASNQSNLLELDNVSGEIKISGINFDGGKTVESGYSAPLAPWDAVVLVVGRGQGENIGDSKQELKGKRSGLLEVTDCSFANSETSGLVAQNLAEVSFKNIKGEKLDALGVFNWNDKVNLAEIVGEKFLSDGIFVVESSGVIRNVEITTARQGIDVHGCDNLTVENVKVIDCAEGYTVSKAWGSGKESSNLTFKNIVSDGAGLAKAIDFVTNLEIDGEQHLRVGEWVNKNDFYHTGINDVEKIRNLVASNNDGQG